MHTKIYGTIGPSCCETEVLVHLFKLGMTGVRMNLSHMNLIEAKEWIVNIKAAYAFVKTENSNLRDLELLIDLRGPELRLGRLRTELQLLEGEKVNLRGLSVPEVVFEYLCLGKQILIDDGKILLEVIEKDTYSVMCEVLRGGILHSGKSIAVLDVQIPTPTLTESDLENIRHAKEYGVTGVMLPFVRGKEDLQYLKQVLKEAGAEDIRIFAKIENMDGVRKIKELLPFCDEIVIARGDLGNAMPLWELPVVQAHLAAICREAKKPFMVVTQMLASMEQSAVPTRAEVSDIFRAVCEGAVSVMLTGETAAGKYPAAAMEYMVNTVRAAEEYKNKKNGGIF